MPTPKNRPARPPRRSAASLRATCLAALGLLAIGVGTARSEEHRKPGLAVEATLSDAQTRFQESLLAAHRALQEGRLTAFRELRERASELRVQIEEVMGAQIEDWSVTPCRSGLTWSGTKGSHEILCRVPEDQLVSLETEADLKRVQAAVDALDTTVEAVERDTRNWSPRQDFFSEHTNTYTSTNLQLAACLHNLGRHQEARSVLTKMLDAFEERGGEFFRALKQRGTFMRSTPEATALLAKSWRDEDLVLRSLRVHWKMVAASLPWDNRKVFTAIEEAGMAFRGVSACRGEYLMPPFPLTDASREPFRSSLPGLVKVRERKLGQLEEDLGITRDQVLWIKRMEEVLRACDEAEGLREDPWSSTPRAICQDLREDLARQEPASLSDLARFTEARSVEIIKMQELQWEIMERSRQSTGSNPTSDRAVLLGPSSSVSDLLSHSFQERFRLLLVLDEIQSLKRLQEEWAQVPEPSR